MATIKSTLEKSEMNSTEITGFQLGGFNSTDQWWYLTLFAWKLSQKLKMWEMEMADEQSLLKSHTDYTLRVIIALELKSIRDFSGVTDLH